MSAFYVAVLSLLGGGIDFPIQQFKTFWMYLTPLVLSYGGLVFVSALAAGPAAPYPRPTSSQSMRVVGGGPPVASPARFHGVMVGTPTSAASMIACCAHHVADLVPLASVFSAASFLVQYQTLFVVGAIGINVALIARVIARIRSSERSDPSQAS